MKYIAQEQGKTHAPQTQLERCVSLHVAAPNPFEGHKVSAAGSFRCTSRTQWSACLIGADQSEWLQVASSTAVVEASATTGSSQNDHIMYCEEPVVAEAPTTTGEKLANEVCFVACFSLHAQSVHRCPIHCHLAWDQDL